MRVARSVPFVLPLLVLLGCGRPAAPAPTGPGPGATVPGAGGADRPIAPGTLLYHARGPGGTQLLAVSEDGRGAAVALSRAKADSIFVSALPGRRVLLAEREDVGTLYPRIARLFAVGLDGSGRELVADLSGTTYQGVTRTLSSGADLAVALSRYGSGGATDVYVLRDGSATLVARGAGLVALDESRVAFLAGASAGLGDLRSAALDGSALAALGGGDGQDRVAEVADGRILLTTHAGAAGDVRLVTLAGGAVDFGSAANEQAFALSGERVIFSRGQGQDAALLSRALDGSDERELAAAATPLAKTSDGRVLVVTGAGALASLDAAGGELRILDASGGLGARVDLMLADRVVYTTPTSEATSLRAARLDGSGATELYAQPFVLPFATGATPDGRVILHTSLAGQLEGGRVLSVRLDGTDLRNIGIEVVDLDGTLRAGGPTDQDFEAVTPQGRVILEAEYETSFWGAQLLQAGSSSTQGQALTELGAVHFAALLP